jgi:hypothetical protein
MIAFWKCHDLLAVMSKKGGPPYDQFVINTEALT